MHKRAARQFSGALHIGIVHDHACLIGLDGQQQHLALLINGGQEDGPMQFTCPNEVVDNLHQAAPTIVRGLRHGGTVHMTFLLSLTTNWIDPIIRSSGWARDVTHQAQNARLHQMPIVIGRNT
jgi:hypothetical protein